MIVKKEHNLMKESKETIAKRIVRLLTDRGVQIVFGIPGEENIHLIEAIHENEKLRFILTRHEQGASFMAEVYGRLTRRPGVAVATLGPGAINLLLGTADAYTTQTPMLIISAQGGLDRIYKKSHQIIDLEAMFAPVTRFSHTLVNAQRVDEIFAEAFDAATGLRPGPAYLAVPQDIELEAAPEFMSIAPLPKPSLSPNPAAIKQAAERIQAARYPIALAGMGIINNNAHKQLTEFIRQTHIPVAVTFMGKGAVSDEMPESLGVVGFMAHDYQNFAFEQSDLILAFGYHFSEFDPVKINPGGNKQIIAFDSQEVSSDSHFRPVMQIVADLADSLSSLKDALPASYRAAESMGKIRALVENERSYGLSQDSSPLKPQSIVMTIREHVDSDTIVLVDTGALKMWMARLYPVYKPNTLLIDNGLSTMSWTLPGAIGAQLSAPGQNVLAVMGDGSFMMNSQELETARRCNVPINVLVWVDNAYGLIKWKMQMAFGHYSEVDFGNPDFIKYAESFGAKAVWAGNKRSLGAAISGALADKKNAHVIFAPVDYSENMKLIEKLGVTTVSL
jgi:acetolactate synthase-1/2/3 large subunit